MQEISFVLTESHEIDSIIHVPISATKRIKYTCLTASESYIAVGSTSGSVYLFSREPCSFIHLVPLSEGAISHVQISPDEKLIALATVRGLVCLVAIRPTIKLIGVSNEHMGEKVECICWNDNSFEVYVGDANGKVSVIVNSIFTVNGMFQAPTCSLMNLDSCIVQMSYESSLLLISTLTRCYLCNTFLEQYKQIGNQTRDGEYGACFFKIDESSSMSKKSENEKIQKFSRKLRTFDFISDNDSNSLDENLIKIFCARPGSRLWEVNTNGIVMKTHQFKEALAISPQPIYKLHSAKSLKIEKYEKNNYPQSIQFFKLFVLQRKYLFSYAPTGIYIIDPINALVILWSGDLKDINSISIIDDKIYLMTHSTHFLCLNFIPVNLFIIKLYEQKLLTECLRATRLFKPNIAGIDRTIDENDLEQLINLIKSNYNFKPNMKVSGIVVVNSGVQNIDIQNNVSDSEDVLVPIKTKSQSSAIRKETNGVSQQTKENRDKRILCEVQEKLKHVYSLIEELKFVLNDEEIERRIREVRKILIDTKKEYESEISGGLMLVFRTTELHCSNMFMENISTNLIERTNRWDLIDVIKDVFIELNVTAHENCSCGYPLPVFDHLSDPKYSDIGIALLRRYKDIKNNAVCLTLCSKIPFLWREYVSNCDKCLINSDDFLKRTLQTKDKKVMSVVLKNLDKQKWKTVISFIKNIEKGKCLFCGKIIIEGNELLINWSEVAGEINNIGGPDTALKFMYQINELLPDVKFDIDVMRQLIFSKILNQHGIVQGVDFYTTQNKGNHAICSTKIRDEIIPLMEKDTNMIIHKNAFGFGSHHWGMQYVPKDSTCPCCTLSLQTPVLLGNNGIALLPCGHAYHVNCMIQKKVSRCNLHSKQCNDETPF